MPNLSEQEASKRLGTSIENLKILVRQGILHPIQRTEDGVFYSQKEIDEIKSRKRKTISDEAVIVNSNIQKDLLSSATVTKKIFKILSIVLYVYIFLLILFVLLFTFYPISTAEWLGIIKDNSSTLFTENNIDSKVLGATTIPNERESITQTIFQPIGKASLNLVKTINPDAYAQIADVTILDPNDVLDMDTDGSLVPERPLNITDSSLLIIESKDLIENLNSQYLQGRQPGTNPGDLAIVGEIIPNTITDTITNTNINGLTNDNLSGNAGISNSNLNNPIIELLTSGPLTGGGIVALGDSLTLDCPSCIIDDSSFLSEDSANTVTNKTIDANNNDLLNIESSNMNAGDYSSVINSGTYSINITGTVSSAADFTGLLTGDVTGTQNSTVVEKINGSQLGLTTPINGNMLIADGSSWITRSLSGDATVNSLGNLTLSNSGTAGTYGTNNSIAIITTDSKGRVISVADTPISGLSSANLISGDYSSVITNGIYPIDISGNSDTATTATNALNFTGTFSGDVSGSQNSTSVDKIKGNMLGLTTPTSGNLLIGDGTSWTTQTISNDATIDSTGVLTLKNIGIPGSYGSSSSIPTITVDAKGRISSATTNPISNLTVANFSSSNISQWINNSQYITDSSTDNLTNKTISGLTNTISDIQNLSLSNSSLTFAGNIGSGPVSLGGVLTILGSGINTATYSGGTTTITATEADTLAAVAGRGAATATTLTLNGGITTTTSTALVLDSGTIGAISIGTGANSKTIGIGNTSGSTSLNLFSGSGNINLIAGPTSSSNKIQVGNSGTALPDLLILDNGTSDPTGVNGGMYYNTTSGKFRCYQNSSWNNCITVNGADMQNASSYDTSEALTNIAAAQVTITSVTVTPTTATGDIYVRAKAEILSSNATDQTLVLSIEDNATCTGSTLATNSITITSASGTVIGDFELSTIEVDAGTSAQAYSLCASTATGDTDIRLYQMFATVIDTGSDLAEIYTTSDSSLEVGDVVSLDTNLKTGIKKSTTSYDKSVIGVVSTRPGTVIGSVEKEGVKAVPIALSGRVPVKVSTLNGSIEAGDYLTTSSIPGVAIKATKAGAIIGTAMASYDGNNIGEILVFVKSGAINNETDNTNLSDTSTQNIISGQTRIDKDETEANIEFKKQSSIKPSVTASINLEDDNSIDEIPKYAIYDITSNGFKIKLANPALHSISFSWIAFFGDESDE